MNIVKIVVVLITVTVLVGCSNTSSVEKNANSQNDKIVNAIGQKDNRENSEKEMYETWKICNDNFYEIIRLLKNKQYSQISYLITENIVINNEELINKAYISGSSFKFEGFTIGKQRSFQFSEDREKFYTGYEILYKDGENIDFCYVTFVKGGDKWLLDFIKIDIG